MDARHPDYAMALCMHAFFHVQVCVCMTLMQRVSSGTLFLPGAAQISIYFHSHTCWTKAPNLSLVSLALSARLKL